MSHSFRRYDPSDKAACLALFDSNCPKYFAPSERADFEGFLGDLDCDYSVLLADGEVAGCGGIHVDTANGQGKLCWGMVDNSRHKSGLGKALLEFRLAAIRANPDATHIHIDTSQHTAPFFEKYGFNITAQTTDGYGPDIDHVEMLLRL
jgi:predicted GNAT family N-acyltransferase